METLAPELLLNILSYFPHIPYPYTNPVLPLPSAALDRFHVLSALTETSRALRAKCLGLLWESVDICARRRGKEGGWEKGCTNEMNALFNFFIESRPVHILIHIRTLNIVLPPKELYSQLAEVVALLPRLETMQILSHPTFVFTSDLSAILEEAFTHSHVSCPSVRSLSIPATAHVLLTSFPNITRLFCRVDPRNKVEGVVGTVERCCPRVQEFYVEPGICEDPACWEGAEGQEDETEPKFREGSVTWAIVKAMPNLRVFPPIIILPEDGTPTNSLAPLHTLPFLRSLHLRPVEPAHPHTFKIIGIATKLLGMRAREARERVDAYEDYGLSGVEGSGRDTKRYLYLQNGRNIVTLPIGR